mgnify:CR=1 FL=1
MEWTQLWAGVTFAAQNGDAEGLLTAAAAGGLHLFDIVPQPAGSRPVRRMALSETGRSGPQTAGAAAHPKRQGLFFCIRPLLRRRGLWAGCSSFSLCCSGYRALSGSLSRWA